MARLSETNQVSLWRRTPRRPMAVIIYRDGTRKEVVFAHRSPETVRPFAAATPSSSGRPS